MIARIAAMASAITLHAPGRDIPEDAVAGVAEVFGEVERVATRFDPDSPLMRCNRRIGEWVRAPELLVQMLELAEAWRQATGGLFDPRILPALSRAGYRGAEAAGPLSHGPLPDPWFTAVRDGGREAWVRLACPVDLGGMGKGFACDLAARVLQDQMPSFLLDAGGDIFLHGRGPLPEGRWPVGIEDPLKPGSALVVVSLPAPSAVATSSVARRHWRGPDGPAHHLIDPRTLRPAELGILAVSAAAGTVLAAEVRAKALFVAGPAACAAAEAEAAPLWWLDPDGGLHGNCRARQRVLGVPPLAEGSVASNALPPAHAQPHTQPHAGDHA
jgi:thiamine biosynthesis lipoprotein